MLTRFFAFLKRILPWDKASYNRTVQQQIRGGGHCTVHTLVILIYPNWMINQTIFGFLASRPVHVHSLYLCVLVRPSSFSRCPITPPRSSLISRARTPIRPGQTLPLGMPLTWGIDPQSCKILVSDSACRPIPMDGVLVPVHRIVI